MKHGSTRSERRYVLSNGEDVLAVKVLQTQETEVALFNIEVDARKLIGRKEDRDQLGGNPKLVRGGKFIIAGRNELDVAEQVQIAVQHEDVRLVGAQPSDQLYRMKRLNSRWYIKREVKKGMV